MTVNRGSTWLIEVSGKRMNGSWTPWRPLHGCYALRRQAVNQMDGDTTTIRYRPKRYVRVVQRWTDRAPRGQMPTKKRGKTKRG